MQMKLSVVMGMVDKISAPLKGVASETDRYAKEIKQVQKAQANDSAAMGMIDSYKKSQKALSKNNLAVAAASEKLKELQAKQKSATTPSAALTQKIAKQKEMLGKLISEQENYQKHLGKVGKELKKTGVNTKKLDSEYDRLNQSYKKHGKAITSLEKKYKNWQRVARGVQKVNSKLKMPSISSGLMATAGVMAPMVGLGTVVNSTASELDELKRAADDIDMPVAQLQAMRLQAKQAGAESEDMDAAIREMALRWGEMKSFQSGAMNDYFEDTGNKKAYNDLMNAKDASEAYQVLLREIAAETDVAKQNFMADEFFGGDSEKMLSLLKGGTKGFQDAKQLLKDTGGPVSDEALENAKAFRVSIKNIGAIFDSLKIYALTPIMGELAEVMAELANNMKDVKWRDEQIKWLIEMVSRVFSAFKAIGAAMIWVSENFKEFLAVIALVKIAFIALNAVMLANPIGLIIAGVAAAIVVIAYLIDKFIGFNNIIKKVKEWWEGSSIFEIIFDVTPIGMMMNGINLLLEKLGGLTGIMDSVKGLWNSLWGDDEDAEKQVNVIRTQQEVNARQRIEPHPSQRGGYGASRPSQTQGGYGMHNTASNYQPLNRQTVNSKSEVAIKIHSDKPVTVDKAESDKNTALDMDVGNMAWGY